MKKKTYEIYNTFTNMVVAVAEIECFATAICKALNEKYGKYSNETHRWTYMFREVR